MIKIEKYLFVCPIYHVHFKKKFNAERHFNNVYEEHAATVTDVPAKLFKQDENASTSQEEKMDHSREEEEAYSELCDDDNKNNSDDVYNDSVGEYLHQFLNSSSSSSSSSASDSESDGDLEIDDSGFIIHV